MKHIEGTDLYIVSKGEIDFKNIHSRQPRSTCPVCSETREHPNDTSVAWNLTAGVGYCHHCHASFKLSENQSPDDYASHYITKGKKKQSTEDSSTDFRSHLLPLDKESILYLNARGISEATAQKAGICSRNIWRATFWEHWVAFPFYMRNRVCTVQYKLADTQHKQFFFEHGGQLIPWNIDCVLRGSGSEILYITEGMMDALALMECGFSSVVSVPNGTGSKLEYFDVFHKTIVKKFSKIVFAGDTDGEGLKLRERVINYFSDIEVCPVTWEYNDVSAKDADEMLMRCGPEAVRYCLSNCEEQPEENVSVFGDDGEALDKLLNTGIPTGKGIGLEGFDDIVHFEEGNVLLVTGYPGSGKSTLVNFICCSMLRLYSWKTVFFSPEKMPQKYHEAEMVSLVVGKPFNKNEITQKQFEHAKEFLCGNILYISEQVSEIEDILRMMRRIVRKTNAKILVIDPFVYLTIPAIPGASETQKIAEMLKKLSLATRDLNIVLILVAHPRKPSGEVHQDLSLYEVSGSANFYNFCDAGIILERVRGTDCVVKVTCGKARREYNGALGECRLAYDASCGRYCCCDHDNNGLYLNTYKEFNHEVWDMCSVGKQKDIEFPK